MKGDFSGFSRLARRKKPPGRGLTAPAFLRKPLPGTSRNVIFLIPFPFRPGSSFLLPSPALAQAKRAEPPPPSAFFSEGKEGGIPGECPEMPPNFFFSFLSISVCGRQWVSFCPSPGNMCTMHSSKVYFSTLLSGIASLFRQFPPQSGQPLPPPRRKP